MQLTLTDIGFIANAFLIPATHTPSDSYINRWYFTLMKIARGVLGLM